MFLKKFFRLVPHDPLARGLNDFNRGRLQEALEAFEELFSHPDPEVQKKSRLYACESRLQLGDELVARDPEAALVHFQAGADLQPGWADIHNRLGEAYHRLARFSQAERCFGQALAINDRYFVARLNLTETLAAAGNISGAAEELAILLDGCPPAYREALEDLAADFAAKSDTDWVERFATVRALAPSNLDVARQNALVAIQNGEADQAIPLLDELIAEHPNFPDLHHLLGLAHGDQGDHDRAVACFKTALDLNQHYLKARINLAFTYMEREQFAEAEAELRLALKTDPENSLAHSALAEIESVRANA